MSADPAPLKVNWKYERIVALANDIEAAHDRFLERLPSRPPSLQCWSVKTHDPRTRPTQVTRLEELNIRRARIEREISNEIHRTALFQNDQIPTRAMDITAGEKQAILAMRQKINEAEAQRIAALIRDGIDPQSTNEFPEWHLLRATVSIPNVRGRTLYYLVRKSW